MGLLSALGRLGGRSAKRAAPAVMDDLPAFRIASTPRAYSSDELRALGQGPQPRFGSGEHWMDGGRPNATNAIMELQAMRNKLTELRRERRLVRTQAEADDIDMQIAVLARDLGIEPW